MWTKLWYVYHCTICRYVHVHVGKLTAAVLSYYSLYSKAGQNALIERIHFWIEVVHIHSYICRTVPDHTVAMVQQCYNSSSSVWVNTDVITCGWCKLSYVVLNFSEKLTRICIQQGRRMYKEWRMWPYTQRIWRKWWYTITSMYVIQDIY